MSYWIAGWALPFLWRTALAHQAKKGQLLIRTE